MKFEDFLSAQKHAHEKKKESGPKPPAKENGDILLSPEGVNFFIDLQTKTFGKETADYHKYAQALWREFFKDNQDENSVHFKEFEGALIRGLHEINTKEHLYPEITRNLGKLIQNYGDSVKKVVLWSTGDVSATGFQISKIERSGVINNFYKNLRMRFEKAKAKEFMREKTEYIVDDDKFARLAEYVKGLLAENPKDRIKLVIIEDTATNFDKVKSILQKVFGEEVFKKIRIVPIWAVYSRYGKRGRETAQAQGREESFEQKKKVLNGIDSFDDLNMRKNRGRFTGMFNGAHVFIDFDGVLSNDETRRVEQAEIVFRTLADSAERMGLNKSMIIERIHVVKEQ